MIRPGDCELARRLETTLVAFSQKKQELRGIVDALNRESFVQQLIESIRRVKYVSVVKGRDLGNSFTNPRNDIFDPIKAAIVHQRAGNHDEAFWLVFLFVHFGKHHQGGWRYVRDVYGRLKTGNGWTWLNTSANPTVFREWLHAHEDEIKRQGGPGGFGNHRKYQSLSATSPTGTGATVESYVEWIGPSRAHSPMFDNALRAAGGNAREAFDALFHSMSSVVGFGRTARFDYLAMVGKLGLAAIEPGSTYLGNSTGPLMGARLLFGGSKGADLTVNELEEWIRELESDLRVGMQALEDAICNWQKSPSKFIPFRA